MGADESTPADHAWFRGLPNQNIFSGHKSRRWAAGNPNILSLFRIDPGPRSADDCGVSFHDVDLMATPPSSLGSIEPDVQAVKAVVGSNRRADRSHTAGRQTPRS